MNVLIPKPISGGLILSYKCSAACRHCMYACSPKWESNWITEDDLSIILSQLSRHIEPAPYGPKSIGLSHGLHFTGGEPFLNFELLCTAVGIAESLNIPSTFVETNAVWCTDDETTKKKLTDLKILGLKGVMISVNPFYAEFVPFSRTERCIRMSLEIFGQNVFIYQIEYYKKFKKWGLTDRVPFEKYLKMETSRNLFRNIEFFISGRTPYTLREMLEDHFNRFSGRQLCSVSCSPPFLREWHNHFDNYGNYMPGFCGGISFGNCRNLDQLLTVGIDPDRKPVLAYLAREDFQGLFDFACQRGYEETPEGYFSKCHFCIDMRKYLVSIDNFDELTPKQFYKHIDNFEAPTLFEEKYSLKKNKITGGILEDH